jgi:hypothetical protein
MNHYQKTALGLDALQQRHIPLNARQRRLLVLIGTEDFEQLADQFKQRIATPEILEQLIELGLIHSTQTAHVSSPIQPSSEAQSSTSVLENSQNNVNPIDLDSTAQTPAPQHKAQPHHLKLIALKKHAI